MDILVIGGGGREHAIIKALKKSPRAGKIYCAPGNAGIALDAECLPIKVDAFDEILAFLNAHEDVKLTVVAPDNPLADGLVNILEDNGHRAFGPRAEAAVIEASKIFSKNLMKKYGIPTADYATFSDFDEAERYVLDKEYPLVIKADGLAYGKGVIICENPIEARSALKEIMMDCAFGANNTKVIVEQFLRGREVSVLTFTDGKSVCPMLSSQDHKKIFDGDMGPNTGGMGAFSPSPYYTEEIAERAYHEIILPTVSAMNTEGRTFKGVLYFGLMVVKNRPYVLEYNARFGDPETQAVLPLLKTDLLDIFEAVVEERLEDVEIKWKKGYCVNVMAASMGYPGSYERGKEIKIGDVKDAVIYHSGTAEKDGKTVTNGGRVISVSALGNTMEEAKEKAYAGIRKIEFEGMYYRKDIGKDVQ